jgi:predicted aspartyl protease
VTRRTCSALPLLPSVTSFDIMHSTRYLFRKTVWVVALLGPVSILPLIALAANGPIEVPFEFYRDSVIVQVKVAGKGPFNMLLDTGVNPSVIDRETAKEIGLKLSTQGEQGSGSGTEVNLNYATSLPIVELGELRAINVEALATDLAKMSKTLGKPLLGVLGYSLLKDRVVQFDYPKQRARFYASSPYPNAAPASNNSHRTTLRFAYHDDILVEGILVNGKKITATIDTGSNGTFQFTPGAITRLGLEKEAGEAQPSHSVGFNGTAQNRKGTVRNITIGGISVDAPDVVFFNKGAGYDDAEWGLRIGNAFLKKFVMTLDYQKKILTLERPK